MEDTRFRPGMAVLLVACALAGGCGKFSRIENGGFTEVKFTRGFMSYDQGELGSLATMNGGIMIYAYSSSFVTNMKLGSEDDPNKSITLPNGSYSFYAFGYIGASAPFRSRNRCAITGDGAPVVLNGTPQTITLNMSRATCADGAFVNSSSYTNGGTDTDLQYSFARVQFKHCGPGATGTSAMEGTAWSFSQGCGFGATAYRWQQGEGTAFGSGMSYQVFLPIFKKTGSVYERMDSGLQGECNYVDTGGEIIASTMLPRVPMGNSAKPGLFPVELLSYGSTDCSGSAAAVHYFRDGLIFGPGSGSSSTVSRSFAGTDSEKTTTYFVIGN